MITCYFGVPGCGKTTLMTKFAQKEIKRIKKGRSVYKHVYTNFYCKGAEKIEFNDLAKFKIIDSLIVLDELAMDADNRKFKSFSDELRDFFILHRHLGCDIIYATQSYEMVDLKIRQLTAQLWYMQKTVVPFLSMFTTAKKVYRTIAINEHTSDLTLGYRFCNLIEAFFASNYKCVFRPRYYKYFDSFDEDVLKQRIEFDSVYWGADELRSDDSPAIP
ncbi:MAG: hypothetical protein IJN93_05190 [Clostridia bacterium]|nr:hypothetical protein [Clostridia bacterium]